MREYQLFFKDCLSLSSMAKSETQCLSFNIERDILQSATSSFVVTSIPANVNEGDVVGLIDPYGTILYLGVVLSMDETNIQATQIESLFNDLWLYRVPNQNTIENSLLDILTNDFKGAIDPIMSAKYNFSISSETSSPGSFPTLDDQDTKNFESFLYEIYSTYGVRLYFDIPYSSGTPRIFIAKRNYVPLKISNNTRAIARISPTTEIAETNKLIVYSSEKVYRETYYLTADGITTDSHHAMRLPVVRTNIVFSDDDLATIVASELPLEMYNHYIEFDMLLNTHLYDFNQWELGMPLSIWLNEEYFDSIFTGYSLFKEQASGMSTVTIKCGKVRRKLTSQLLGAFR